MDGRFWLELLSAVAYGALSSLVPVFYIEAYIVAAVASDTVGLAPMVVGLALGQSLGKLATFWAVRQGKKLPIVQRRSTAVVEGSWRARWQALVRTSTGLVDHPVWGRPIMFVSVVTSIPPVYPMVLVAGASRMGYWWFGGIVLVGFLVRGAVAALAVTGLITLW